AELFSNRHNVSERLERMMARRFEIEDRHVRVPRESPQHRIADLVTVAHHLRKRAHANRGDVARKHASSFFNMLRLIAIHSDGLAVFQAPRPFANIKRDGIAAKLVNTYFHRSSRAKRRIEKDERDAATCERAFVIVPGLDLRCEVYERRQLIKSELRC